MRDPHPPGPLARWIVRGASLLVPRAQRREWLDEWSGELEALSRLRGEGTDPGKLPGATAFALGAVPHAFWIMR